MKKITITTEVENKLDTLLDPVFQNEEDIVMEKDGIPVAMIISIKSDKDYEEYQHMRAQQRLRELNRKLNVEAKRQGLTEEQLRKELKETRREVYQERYGHRA